MLSWSSQNQPDYSLFRWLIGNSDDIRMKFCGTLWRFWLLFAQGIQTYFTTIQEKYYGKLWEPYHIDCILKTDLKYFVITTVLHLHNELKGNTEMKPLYISVPKSECSEWFKMFCLEEIQSFQEICSEEVAFCIYPFGDSFLRDWPKVFND